MWIQAAYSADRSFCKCSAHEFLAHPLSECSHRDLLSLQPTLIAQGAKLFPRPANYARPPRQRLRPSRPAFRKADFSQDKRCTVPVDGLAGTKYSKTGRVSIYGLAKTEVRVSATFRASVRRLFRLAAPLQPATYQSPD